MSGQTVFVSSVMDGMAAERDAARRTIEGLGGRAILFEHLGGTDDDAQTAYLTGVRSSDIYVGILGERYGRPAPTGYSPTHAEYKEAIDRGLRVSVWATTGPQDGPQQDFLAEVRTFHTTGSYSTPEDLGEGLTQRLRGLAAASCSPWCKVGRALFRAQSCVDDGKKISIDALIRDHDIVAELEGLRPDAWRGNRSTAITCAGRTDDVHIDVVSVGATAGMTRSVRIDGSKAASMGSDHGLIGAAYNGMSAEDLTDLALRVALFGEPNPLGELSFLAEMDNPLAGLEQLALDEDSFSGLAEVLLVESLVGSGLASRISSLRIGPARSGRPVRMEWIEPSRHVNVEPARRRLEGKLKI